MRYKQMGNTLTSALLAVSGAGVITAGVIFVDPSDILSPEELGSMQEKVAAVSIVKQSYDVASAVDAAILNGNTPESLTLDIYGPGVQVFTKGIIPTPPAAAKDGVVIGVDYKWHLIPRASVNGANVTAVALPFITESVGEQVNGILFGQVADASGVAAAEKLASAFVGSARAQQASSEPMPVAPYFISQGGDFASAQAAIDQCQADAAAESAVCALAVVDGRMAFFATKDSLRYSGWYFAGKGCVGDCSPGYRPTIITEGLIEHASCSVLDVLNARCALDLGGKGQGAVRLSNGVIFLRVI